MTTQCPKCNTENADTARFCSDCGTQLIPPKDIPVQTRTLETPVPELPRGTLFAGRYEIIEELGTGGMGKVYRVEDTKAKEEIALKLLKPEIAADKKTIERFRNELTTARKIRHKNICGMYDIGEENGTYFITMEYVPGEDLKSFLRRSKKLTVETAVSIGKQICEGLTEAHKSGVVHRDLKPGNIMIDTEGNVRIMDFGIAQSLSTKAITVAGTMIGTPEYMSPEQAEGKDVDHRSDIYSLGVILFEMVTGQPPFEGDSPLSVAMKHKSELPVHPKTLNPQISPDLNRLILMCLEKNKDKRWQSALDLMAELEKVSPDMPATKKEILKKRPRTSKEITVQLNLKKAIVPALVFIAIVVIGIAIWQIIPQREAAPGPKIENSIAVMSFENQTGDKAYDYLQRAIPNLLITSLERRGGLYVATWERLRDLLKQMGKEDVEFIDSDMGFSLCRREGIGAIVLGSFVKAGDTFATDVKVLDVETKKLLKSASSRGRDVDSILERQIDELSGEISLGMGIREPTGSASQFQIAEVTTTSMEAYDYFLKGEEAWRKAYDEEAREFYEKAVSIDPKFAMAYLKLAETHYWLGNFTEINDAIKKAMELSDNSTEKERLHIEIYYSKYIEKDPEKYLKLMLQFSEKYPKEKWIHYELGTYYYIKRDHAKALEECNKALEIDPNYGYALNQIAYTYLGMENYEKAIEYFKKNAAVAPGEAFPLDSMGDAYFRMGRIEEAISKYKEALEIKPDFYSSLKSIPYLYALKEDYSAVMSSLDRYIDIAQSQGEKQIAYFCKGFYYAWLGNLKKCLENLQRSEDLEKEVNPEFAVAHHDGLRAYIYLDMGKLELSRHYIDSWYDVVIKSYPLTKFEYSFVLGLIEVKEGKIDSAKQRLADLGSLPPDINPNLKENFIYYYNFFQAEVFLAEVMPEKCIAVLEKTSPPKPPMLDRAEQMIFLNTPFLKDALPRAYRQKGDLDKAISAYEDLITLSPEKKGRFLVHPLYHYRLAQLYEEKGWKGKAIEHYEKFLDLWKDADPEIAEFEDAKTRVWELQDR